MASYKVPSTAPFTPRALPAGRIWNFLLSTPSAFPAGNIGEIFYEFIKVDGVEIS